MARLSEEHYSSTGVLPTSKHTRTSSRMRDIFKPRRSTSSTSPNTLTKSAPSAVASATDSPSPQEPIRALAQNISKIFECDVEPSENSDEVKDTEREDTFVDSSNAQHGKSLPPDHTNLDDKKAVVENVSVLSFSPIGQDATKVEQRTRTSQGVLASNIFDGQDALSTGIREYVDSKIAETLHGHSCHCHNRTSFGASPVFETDGVSRPSTLKRIPVDINLFHGDKRVGPFTLKYSSDTYVLQMSVFVIYILGILLAAFLGPKTLLITVWKVFVALLAYSIAGQFLRWSRAHDDLFVTPALFIAGSAYNAVCDIIDDLGGYKV